MTFSPRTFSRCLFDLGATLASLHAPAERVLFLRICVVGCLVPSVMRLPLRRLGRVVEESLRRSVHEPRVAPDRIAELVELAQARLHPLVRRGCLARGVSLLWILRRNGLDVSLVFGIGGDRDGDQGHCWLVLDGDPFLERHPVDGRFVEVYRIPEAVRG